MARKKIFSKKWWKEHWDEILLAVGFLIGFYFILKGGGIDAIEIIKKIFTR